MLPPRPSPAARGAAVLLLPLLAAAVAAQPEPTGPRDLRELLAADPRFERYLADGDEYRLQLLVGEVVETEDGRLVLQHSALGDLDRYFYPASSIKLCVAVATLLDLDAVNADGGTHFGLQSHLTVLPGFAGDLARSEDDTNLDDGQLTVAHTLRKMLVVSDNQAFNDLYELVGHREVNDLMHRAGLGSVRIQHRLGEWRVVDEQRRTRPVQIAEGDEVLARPTRTSDLIVDNGDLPGIELGVAYYRDRERVEGPFSFRDKNRISVADLQTLLVEVVRPEIDTGARGFPELAVEQREFLHQHLRMLPRECPNPSYPADQFPDQYVKYVLPGVRRVIPEPQARVYDKIGRAYGFTVENAYVEDGRTGRGYFLTAVLYTNPNGVLNDDDYAYEELADPFFADLGEVLTRAVLGL